ncbi:hypothetical protein [Erythrobacter dokdonensis]|nr:hypothetical protein [Erythrobacter dokdonensis]
MRLATFLVIAFQAVCGSLAPLAARDGALPASEWDFIAFEVKSWGQPVSSWRITSSGEGSWTEVRKAAVDAPAGDIAVWHEIPAEAQLALALRRVFDRLPPIAPDYGNCANFMSDLPYGTLRLTKGATTTEIAWNSGCLDDGYVAFIGLLKEADSLVAAAGRQGQMLREEPLPGP